MRPPTRQRPIRRDWNGAVCFSCRKSGHATTRCPALDESFPFMLPGWRAESTPGGGGGVATQISSNVRPQDPGGGAPMLAACRSPTDDGF